MTWIEDVSAHMVTELSLVAGSTLFVGRRSDDEDLPDAGVILTEYGGGLLDHFGKDNDLEIPNLQAFVRSDRFEYASGMVRAWSIHRLLRRVTNQTLGSTMFLRIEPTTTPNPLGEDSLGRFQFTVDFSVIVEEPS